MAALHGGKHVMWKKPLATSVNDGEHMVELPTESGGSLSRALILYAPAVVQVRSLLDQGKMGTLLYMSAVARMWARLEQN